MMTSSKQRTFTFNCQGKLVLRNLSLSVCMSGLYNVALHVVSWLVLATLYSVKFVNISGIFILYFNLSVRNEISTLASSYRSAQLPNGMVNFDRGSVYVLTSFIPFSQLFSLWLLSTRTGNFFMSSPIIVTQNIG